jgi:hypothetical protein
MLGGVCALAEPAAAIASAVAVASARVSSFLMFLLRNLERIRRGPVRPAVVRSPPRWRAGRDRNKAITTSLAVRAAPGGDRRNTAARD